MISLKNYYRTFKTAITTNDPDELKYTYGDLDLFFKENLIDPIRDRAYEEEKTPEEVMTTEEEILFDQLRAIVQHIFGDLEPGEKIFDVWHYYTNYKANNTDDYTAWDFVSDVLTTPEAIKKFNNYEIFYDPDLLVVDNENNPVWPSPYIDDEEKED